jgi:FkbM family methyltransferase
MSFSIKIGNFLFKRSYFLYKKVYGIFKKRQDAFEISLLQKFIREGNIVLDIGANIGFYASILSQLVGKNGEVHCFEPDEKNFQHLQKTCKNLSNVIINNAAVGPQTEKINIYTSPNLNVDHRTYEPETYEKKLEVNAIKVDDYVSAKKLNIDFIKMDIQGFEMQALKGMKNTLAQNPDIKLISEFWPYGLKKSGSSVVEYFDSLSDLGFKCYLLEENNLSLLNSANVEGLKDLPESTYFNILAIKSDV